MIIVVSRHAGAVEWLRRQGVDVSDVRAQVSPDDVRGHIVVGNLPLALAALCREVRAIEFAGAAPRGAEYSADDMDAAGARLARYRVQSLDASEALP